MVMWPKPGLSVQAQLSLVGPETQVKGGQVSAWKLVMESSAWTKSCKI